MLDTFKKKASLLASYLESINRKVSHGQALEALARTEGSKSWNVLSAQLKANLVSKAAPASDSTTMSASRPERLAKSEPPVSAELHSDDDAVQVDFDAAAWFAQASDEELVKLAAENWGHCSVADDVARHFRAHRADVNSVFDYVEDQHRLLTSRFRDPIGYECDVDELDALAWVKHNRPHLLEPMLANATWDAEAVADHLAALLAPQAEGVATAALGDAYCPTPMIRIQEVDMQSVVGDYDDPETVPEWVWVKANARFSHVGNGAEPGVWEFMVRTERADDPNLPEKLRPVMAQARTGGAIWVMFHQG